MLWIYKFFYKIVYFPCGGCPHHPLFLASFLILFSFSSFAQTKNYVSKVWVADNGDGTYKNPFDKLIYPLSSELLFRISGERTENISVINTNTSSAKQKAVFEFGAAEKDLKIK